jgi:hypothetical protein
MESILTECSVGLAPRKGLTPTFTDDTDLKAIKIETKDETGGAIPWKR